VIWHKWRLLDFPLLDVLERVISVHAIPPIPPMIGEIMSGVNRDSGFSRSLLTLRRAMLLIMSIAQS